MDKNILITLQYDGTRYSGWQRQGNTDNTIETKISLVLKNMLDLDYNVEIHGSGRTDSGVHAMGQTANFHINTDKEPSEIKDYLNRYLPEDIKVIEACVVDKRFHARLSVKKKEYVYSIDTSDKADVFTRKYSWNYSHFLDVDKMQSAVNILVGRHDFASFSDMKGKKSTVRTIENISIEKDNNYIRITFLGEGFLYHMVRKLTAAIVMIGTGDLTEEQLIDILNKKDKKAFSMLAPAKGLCLKRVYY